MRMHAWISGVPGGERRRTVLAPAVSAVVGSAWRAREQADEPTPPDIGRRPRRLECRRKAEGAPWRGRPWRIDRLPRLPLLGAALGRGDALLDGRRRAGAAR